ncbi:DUF805 domain-containing protein [uncultured Acinetobacter sp.]|uniref:DUF805 domain-containing protein n=1 Tax=uncultured Acinetobacter sp. TaxID=165433 RepID=UPI0025CC7666|nr:DUF805 domain-containing protein [uncultured Acinetobacter sp.]
MNSNFQTNDSALSASGRFGRMSYLGWSFLSALVFFIVAIVVVVLMIGTNPESISGLSIPAMIIFLVLYIAFFYFTFVFTIRRLHDKNQSGWLSLVMLVPFINFFFLVYLCCAKGDEGTNNYGAPRVTKAWEKVLAWIYIITIPLMGVLTAISIPAYQSYIERAQLQQLEYQQQIEQSE